MLRQFLLICSFFVHSMALIAQDSYQNIDWKALNHFENGYYNEAIGECQKILVDHQEDLVANRVRLLLGRSYMALEKFDEALKTLKEAQLDAAFIKSGILGLIADCKSEQGKIEEAHDLYLKAIHAEFNASTTPTYLFKAYLCAKKLDRKSQGDRYIQTIIDNFWNYSQDNQIDKYLVNDSARAIVLYPSKIEPLGTLGIGTINGKKVNPAAFVNSLKIARENKLAQASYQGQLFEDIDEDLVWNAFVEDQLFRSEYELLGINSDYEELMAYLLAEDGYSPQSEFLYSRVFVDENGNFLPSALLARIDEMQNSTEPDQREAWKNTQEYYIKKLIREKYLRFISLTVFISTAEIEQIEREEKVYYFDYRSLHYSSISGQKQKGKHNKLIVQEGENQYEKNGPDFYYTDKELKAFYETHKKDSKYQLEKGQRTIRFIRDHAVASASDTAKTYLKILKLKDQFSKTLDDSAFVIKHSEFQFYTSGAYSTAILKGSAKDRASRYQTYPQDQMEEMESAETGSIIGPYLENDDLVLSKVIGHTDEILNARHILIKVEERDDSASKEAFARKLIESINDENFSSFAEEYSGDLGSAENGGDLGDFFFGDMVPQFAEYCVSAPIGEIGLVRTQFGFHIVQVKRRFGKKLPRLARVVMPIETSSENFKFGKDKLLSIRRSYMKEIDEIAKESSANLFESIAQDNSEFARKLTIQDNSPKLMGFYTKEAEDSLLTFAYDPNVSDGDVSAIFRDSNSFVLFQLSEISKSGVPSFASISDRIEMDFVREKKSVILLEKLKRQTNSEIKEQTQNYGASLEHPRLAGVGIEYRLISKAIQSYENGDNGIYANGHSGMFFIKITEEKQTDSDRTRIAEFAYLRSVDNKKAGIGRALFRMNSIIDNRRLFQLGIRL